MNSRPRRRRQEGRQGGEGGGRAKLSQIDATEIPAKGQNQGLGEKTEARGGIKQSWAKEWQSSIRYKRFPVKDISVPSSKKYIELTNEHRLMRQMTSLIFQLRTGHAPLNDRFGKVDSSRCPACGEASQTVEHYMLAAPNTRTGAGHS
jgi:hypothetical protein